MPLDSAVYEMGLFEVNVYKTVFKDEKLFHNHMENCLWQGKTFCLLGFDDGINSGKNLILLLIANIASRGASIVKLPNESLDSKILNSVHYYLCNYSLGYSIRPRNALESRFITPIWLYACNRDNVIYESNYLPIFKPVENFHALKFLKDNITLAILGASEDTGGNANSTRFDLDTLLRFIRHCGFNSVPCTQVKDTSPNDLVYIILCTVLLEEIDDEIFKVTRERKIPCLSVEWLFDCYASGELENVSNYAVNLCISGLSKWIKLIFAECSNASLGVIFNL
ncbi:bifunctional BRCT domain superfamily/BRCT domain [Babesia duncani]|uniref:Bifunctional BRCT domain superfamily/BRCT domain n=1 Tax=Babesia duncani TaxID=323732 RepID=A0AAD9PPJ3_9APIC|nr:bifunctional BRCT domain superfamily/BRCT domain [Babesia duncani]